MDKYSDTQLISAALNTLREEGITDISVDSSAARHVKNKFNMLIDAFLTSVYWQCATKTANLVRREAESPYDILPYVFTYPADALLPISVIVDGNPYDLSDQYYGRPKSSLRQAPIIEGNLVYHSESTCTLRYLRRIPVSQMRNYMIYPLQLFIASDIAYGVANTASFGDVLLKRYERELAKAEEKNNKEINERYRVGESLKGRSR